MVCCEGEASTVYRLMNEETMKLLSQIRVTFTYTLFGMPRYDDELELTGFEVRQGRSYVIVSRDTTTTSRDW
jgi:hypothetical protein